MALDFITPSVLPRLIYIADLEVYPSYAGAIQMLRLLSCYPPERLMLVYPGADQRRGIPLAGHATPPSVWWAKYFNARGGRHLLLIMNLLSWCWWKVRGGPPGWILSATRNFEPEAVVTVGLGGAWALADAFARHHRLPLHVFIHDDRHYCSCFPPFSHAWIERKFGRILQRAASAMVASPRMAQIYRERFNVASTVIYPSHDYQPDELPSTTFSAVRPITRLVYAGSIWGRAQWILFDRLATELSSRGCALAVYSTNHPPAHLKLQMEIRPAVPAHDLGATLRREADVLLQFTPFEPGSAGAVSTLFPSKLADYSTTGLPILMVGPDWSSTAWLAREYPDAFAFVLSDDPRIIAETFCVLAAQPDRARTLATNFHALARKLFSLEANFQRFRQCLTSAQPSAVPRSSGMSSGERIASG